MDFLDTYHFVFSRKMNLIGHNTSNETVHVHGGDQHLAKLLRLVVNRDRSIDTFIAALLNSSFKVFTYCLKRDRLNEIAFPFHPA